MKHDFATKPGFNATTPRFNYIKNHIRMAEVPGPGSYDRNKSQETNVRKSPEKMYQEMSAQFRDATDRDDYLSYKVHDMKRPPVAPNNYFENGRPFLKKSFNASLPPPRFA